MIWCVETYQGAFKSAKTGGIALERGRHCVWTLACSIFAKVLALESISVGSVPMHFAPIRGDESEHDGYDHSSASESYWSTVANRFLYSNYYTTLYIIVFLTQLVLFCYGMANYVIFRELSSHDLWYVLLDIFCTLMLVCEVAIRVIAHKAAYFNSWANVLDMIVMVVAIVALFFYFIDPQTAIYGSLILALRYGAQLVRLVLLVKSHGDRKHMLSAMERNIDFTELERAESDRDRRWANYD